MSSPFGAEKDTQFMKVALEQAHKAFEHEEVPIGAVIVDAQENIVAQAHNLIEAQKTQTAHAEMIAIQDATKKLGDWRLDDHWLYVTLEPCSMCMGLIRLSRLAGVVFGAPSPLFGYRLDNNGISQVYKSDSIATISGVGEQEAVQLLKQFFQEKRIKKGE